MICSCRSAYDSPFTENVCEEVACSYFQAVDEFGCSAFYSSQDRACMCPDEISSTPTPSATLNKLKNSQKQNLSISKFGIKPPMHVMKETELIICNVPFEASCDSDVIDEGLGAAFIIIANILGILLVFVFLVCVCCCIHSAYKQKPTMEEKIVITQPA